MTRPDFNHKWLILPLPSIGLEQLAAQLAQVWEGFPLDNIQLAVQLSAPQFHSLCDVHDSEVSLGMLADRGLVTQFSSAATLRA